MSTVAHRLVPPVQTDDPLKRWAYEPQPKAQALVNDLVAELVANLPFAKDLAERMRAETGTRFVDWIDSIELPGNATGTGSIRARIAATGWARTPVAGAPDCHTNFLGVFPRIVLTTGTTTRFYIKVDSVVALMRLHDLEGQEHIVGRAGEQFRAVCADRRGNYELWAIERHGYAGFLAKPMSAERLQQALHHADAFQTRRREFEDDAVGLDYTESLVDAAVADLGPDLACDLFFEAERQYWMARNHAGAVQKARQDRLGLGWANHDHHTYRCSRHNFRQHIRILERLGLVCRERFYAGSEAGWGAQVMEQPVTGIVTFNDVDLSPAELMTDFAHELLAPRDELGTVGLWCGLHGDSILEAGMHHLEAMFDHESLRVQLEKDHAVRTMVPFTTFPYLRQAFTEGERWAVKGWRIDRLLARKQITLEQGETFRHNGAIGSHLENLERNDGFKGFNQAGVSDIISRTDPRRASRSHTQPASA